MVRKIGRKPIEVIDSVPYSEIIFIIASGVNYAQEIARIRKAQPPPTVRQLKELERLHYLKSQKEKLLNKTTYSVNWEKINEEFVNYLFNTVFKRRQQSIAQFGEKYSEFTKQQEARKVQKSEEQSFKEFEAIKKSKRLDRNKYLQRLFQILFEDCSKAYVQNNIPITIREIFEEAKQSFGFENFIYMMNSSKHPSLKENIDFRDLVTIEEALRFVYRGFLTLNASAKLSSEIEKEVENDLKTTKATKNKENKFGNTNQNNTSTSENGETRT